MTDRRDRSAELPDDRPDPAGDSWSAWLPPPDPTREQTGSAGSAGSATRDAEITQPSAVSAVPRAPVPATQAYPSYVVAPPPPPGQGRVAPPSHLALAIVSMVIGSLPFGIVATVKASRVESLFTQGQEAEAHRVSQQARNWAITAFVVNVAWIFVIIVILAIGGRR